MRRGLIEMVGALCCNMIIADTKSIFGFPFSIKGMNPCSGANIIRPVYFLNIVRRIRIERISRAGTFGERIKIAVGEKTKLYSILRAETVRQLYIHVTEIITDVAIITRVL